MKYEVQIIYKLIVSFINFPSPCNFKQESLSLFYLNFTFAWYRVNIINLFLTN